MGAQNFRQYIDGLAGHSVTADEAAVATNLPRATADRRLNGLAVTVVDVVAVARHYGKSPLAGLVAMGWLSRAEANQPALDTFTDVELCEEILRRARGRALDAPIGEASAAPGVRERTRVTRSKRQRRQEDERLSQLSKMVNTHEPQSDQSNDDGLSPKETGSVAKRVR